MNNVNKLSLWLDSLADNHTPSFAVCCSYLASYFPLLEDFESTEQDKEWHAEGNVAIHTDMVLQALYKLLAAEAAHLSGENRQALILSALLHDIAKPLTTRRKDIAGVERVVASRHEEIGASYLSMRLMDLPLSHSVIMTIMGLVGFHQMPKRLVIKNADFADYLKLSLNADLALLYWLEVADMQGRICSDLDVQIDMLEQFKMFAQEYNLWNNGAPCYTSAREQHFLQHLSAIQVKACRTEQIFVDGYAIKQLTEGQISTVEEAIAKNYQPCQQYGHLYIMCGISGSGKSTWIDNNLDDFEVISLDDIRVELNGRRECQKSRGQVLQLARTRLKKALANKQNVVWDATNIRKDFRKTLCDLGENYGALVTIVAFQQSQSNIRSKDRNRQHAVGDEVITHQLKKLEWPWVTEAHRMIIVGDKGQELARFGSFS